jgi:hypothetical protein
MDSTASPCRGEPLEPTAAQIINDKDFDAVIDESIDEVGADESGAAGDEGLRDHLTSKLGFDDRCG